VQKILKLLELIKNYRNIYIQTHNYPDPDAIASAYALKELFQIKGKNAGIIYNGELQRSIILSMLDIMKINLKRFDKAFLTENDKVIVVDCSPDQTNVFPSGGDVIAVIDHHEYSSRLKIPFTDIRPDLGSVSTIIADYYFSLGIAPPKHAATALAIGINIDTAHFTRKVTKLDFETYSRLIELIDFDLMRFIVINNLELKDLKHLKSALENYRIYKNFLCVNIGENSDANFTGIMSDFFLGIKEIDFAVIYSKREDGIYLSVRSLNPEWDSRKIIISALKGIGSGGGHKHMGGGFIKTKKSINSQYIEEEIFNRFKSVLFVT